MEQEYRRCGGLDLHKDVIEACVLGPDGKGPVVRRKFGTVAGELLALWLWLQSLRVTEVVMESAGIYWRPVWRVLEAQPVKLVLANPQQVKALAGRKSDKRDAKRLAEFQHDGRLDPSFVPPPEIRQLRDLLRLRQAVVQDRSRVANRIEKLLQSYGAKLSSVASDIMGVSGRLILGAIARGESDQAKLAELGEKLSASPQQLAEALRAPWDEHGRFLLNQLLKGWEECRARCEVFEKRLRQQVHPHQEHVRRLVKIPGVSEVVAWTLIAELGVDMSVFPSDRHCASWAGLCPGIEQSAGVQKSGRTRKGNKFLRSVLVQAGWAVSRRKRGYLKAVYWRIASRRGPEKAAVAVAHKILVAAYHILRDKTPYNDLGDDYFDRLHADRTVQRLTKRFRQLGFQVEFPEGDSGVAQPVARITPPPKPPDPTMPSTPNPEPVGQDAPQPRRRGRPCKCAERGLECPHKNGGKNSGKAAPKEPSRKKTNPQATDSKPRE